MCIICQKQRTITMRKGENMDDKFLFGMLLGVVGGAVLATNSAKARQMVKDSQAQVKEKVEQMGKSQNKSEKE